GTPARSSSTEGGALSSAVHPAVDFNRLAGEKRRAVAGEKRDHLGDVLGFAGPSERNRLDGGGERLRAGEVAMEGRAANEAGRDLRAPGDIALQHDRAAAGRADGASGLVRVSLVDVVVPSDVGAVPRERDGRGAPDADAAARHQRNATGKSTHVWIPSLSQH